MSKSLRAGIAFFVVFLALAVAACDSDADKASSNIKKEAEQFKVLRKFVVINGITDKVQLEVTGRCSYESSSRQLVLTCKEEDLKGEANDKFRKHVIGLSDNTIWTEVQLEPIQVSVYRTKVILKPQNIVPDLDLVTG